MHEPLLRFMTNDKLKALYCVLKESNNRYFIGRSATISEMVFQFLRATDYFEPRDFIHFNKDDKEYYWHCLKKELEFYGILEGHHYKHYILKIKWVHSNGSMVLRIPFDRGNSIVLCIKKQKKVN